MTAQLLLIAKEPVPGRVKTRLCPPCTPEQAAALAAAALADTMAAAAATGLRCTLVVDGAVAVEPGWHVVAQRGTGLGDRLAYAFADTLRPGVPSLLIGMDTPQVAAAPLRAAAELLDSHDAVFGPAADGGWWALGLREPAHAAALRGVPMSTSETGRLTLATLDGLRVAMLPELRDVDTAADAVTVAALCGVDSRFARAVPKLVRA
jgi:rSAM/selenodomain-associated transferase 1